MESLKDLVQKYFPDEHIIKESNVKLRDTWVAKVGRLPLSASKLFYLKPMPMIETDGKYYFDKRVPMLFQSILSIFIGPLWLVAFLLIIQTLTKVSYPIELFFALFLLGILVGIINTFISKSSIVNVLTLNKSWISENYKEGEETILKGIIPAGGASYFLSSHIPEEKLGNKILKRFPKNMLYDATFTIRYKQAE